ncbi:MAG: gamma-glutamylcyclotransferase [Terriglobia bacterium]
MPELDTDFLFVYGALRRGFALHHHLRRMRAQFVAAGEVQAELYDLGEFLGARKSTRPGKVVAGEVYRLRQAEKALKVLDHVEGVLTQAPEKSLFQRAITEVVLPNGERRVAWIYCLKDGASARHRASCDGFARPRTLSSRQIK